MGGLLPGERVRCVRPFPDDLYRRSPSWREEVDASVELGVPRSALLGRARTSRTTYRYGDDGRLVEAVTVHDPEWTAEDLEAVLTWQREQSRRCPGCGFPIDEVWVFNPDEEPEKRAAFDAEIRKCVACAHRSVTDSTYRSHRRPDGRPAYDEHGIHIVPRRNER